MKIGIRILCVILMAFFALPFCSGCRRITDEVYEPGKVVVTLDESGLTPADEEGFLFISDGKLGKLSGSANTRARVSDIRADVSCGNYVTETKKLKPSQKWTYDAPQLTAGYNLIKISVTADDGTCGEKIFAILTGEHREDIEDTADDDGDGLSNYKEKVFGTDIFSRDTDGDGAGDREELVLSHTNPTAADDGIKDLRYDDGAAADDAAGSRPKNDEKVTVTAKGADDSYGGRKTEVSAKITAEAQTVEGANIIRLGTRNIFLNPSIPGYIASAYTLRASGPASVSISAKCTGEDVSEPSLYLFDEKGQTLYSAEKQRTEADGTVTGNARLGAEGRITFVLLDRAKAKPYITDGKAAAGTETIGGYKNMVIGGDMRLGTGARLVGLSADAEDSDGDGIDDRSEAEIHTAGGKKFVYLKSDPTIADSDFDGTEDAKDVRPLSYDISDRSMALACAAAYCDLSPYIGMTVGEAENTPEGALALGTLAGSEELDLLRDAEILWQTGNEPQENQETAAVQNVKFDFKTGRYVAAAAVNEKGYGSIALSFPGYEKNGAAVIAYRGTSYDQSEIPEELTERLMYMETGDTPVGCAFDEYKLLSKQAGAECYITAHSTGGGIADGVLRKLCGSEMKYPVRTVTFNAIGNPNAGAGDSSLMGRWKTMNSAVNYYYFGDLLGDCAGKTSLFARLGQNKGYTPKDRDERQLGERDGASLDYHDIKYFCSDSQITGK